MNWSNTAKWMIAIAVFFSVWPYAIFFIGIPLYVLGVIIIWLTKEHIIDKISWTVLPIIVFIVLVIKVYSLY